MKLQVRCDWWGKNFYKTPATIHPHNFCCRQCLSDFSNKSKNPNGYSALKDFTNIAAAMSETNRRLNKDRMTDEVREKLRLSRLNTGERKTYAKRYGRHEHRIVAEQILGRPLLPGEVVHHIDGDKRNNDPRNLRVFASQCDHAKFHAEFNWFIKELKKMEGGAAL